MLKSFALACVYKRSNTRVNLPQFSLSSINLSALRHRADQKQNNGRKREERGERLRQCKHRDKDMVTSPPHHIYTLSMAWWPHSSLATIATLSSRKSSFNLNLRLKLSLPLNPGTERSLVFNKNLDVNWSNCTESCTLRSNEKNFGKGKKRWMREKKTTDKLQLRFGWERVDGGGSSWTDARCWRMRGR